MKTTKLNTNLLVQYQTLEEITVNEANPRTHSDKQIGQIARSIERFDFVNPIIVDGDNKIIAGHGRYMAARKLGLETAPTIRLSQMSEADIRAYVIADNKLAENAGWDSKLLGLELQYLSNIDLDLTTITGFEMPEIDLLIGDLTKDSESEAAEDLIPEIGITPAICQLGDIWKIGNHHLICGDSTKAETYEALLGDKRAQMVFCDAPYNVAINGNVSGLGKIQHREFAMASGEMSQYEFVEFLTTVFNNLVEFSEDGSIHYQCMDFRHMAEILAAGKNTYTELKNLCVWVKNNGGIASIKAR